MAERVTAEIQLERVLYILPAAARPEGATIAELAAALGTTEDEVLRDIGEVTARAFHHPAGTVDSLQIILEAGRLRVWHTSERDLRPVRLSPLETLALGLGLRTLAMEAEPERRAAILALARRLESTLAAPVRPEELDRLAVREYAPRPWGEVRAPAELLEEMPAAYGTSDRVAEPRRPYEPAGAGIGEEYELALGEDELRAVLAEAARERIRCRIDYLKPGDDVPVARTIAPHVLAYAEGAWYVLAHDDLRDAPRIFRLDRILDARLTGEPFEVQPDFDPLDFIRDGRVYHADEDVAVRVRYSPRVAQWLLERSPPGAAREEDGSVVIPHRVASTRWLVQHVLQYGPDAEVLEPPELRRAVVAAAQKLAV